MSLLDKIRGKSESDPATPAPPEGLDTTIDSRSGAGFDATRGSEATLAGTDTFVRTEAPSIISQAVPTDPGPASEFPASSTMSFGPSTQAADLGQPAAQPAT